MNTVMMLALAALAVAAATLVAVLVVLRRSSSWDARLFEGRFTTIDLLLERTERALREELALVREESSSQARHVREELSGALRGTGESVVRGMVSMTEASQRGLQSVRDTVEQRLVLLQDENARKLDEMRRTVDERLAGTLEARLGASFKLVSEQLEQVHRGLGEMQTLATGVGDLKRVLANVKTRGVWGEAQLGALLAQGLAADQYATNVVTRAGSAERVEYAIRLPGLAPDGDAVWLPIDAKFPLEDHQRLVDAVERGDAEQAEAAGKQLEARLKTAAREINEKYINPPVTTDFALLFLPTEGLFADVLRRPGMFEAIQRDNRVVMAGPTTLWAILCSLQMGFRTLAIQRHSSEVWRLLAGVKRELGRFGQALDAVQKKLGEATSRIDQARRGTRAIERRLEEVQDDVVVVERAPDAVQLPLDASDDRDRS
jgi:DNA recombination protein RmuC